MTTTAKDVISAFKDGRLSVAELTSALRSLRVATTRHPLSEGQKGIWALQKMFPDMAAYNVPLCFTARGLHVDVFRRACRFLLEQHPMLGSTVQEHGGSPWRIQGSEPELSFQVENLAETLGASPSDEAIRAYARVQAKKPFVLETGPLFRVQLLHVPAPERERETIVLLGVHHIVFDGESIAMLVDTLFGAYQSLLGGTEPVARPARENYDEFVESEQALLRSEEGARRLAYWKDVLRTALQAPALPTDRPRSRARGSFGGRTRSMLLDEASCSAVGAFLGRHNLSPSALFASVLTVLLERYTKQPEIVIGMPISLRGRAKYHGVMGFFVNMLPVRARVAQGEPVLSLLRQMQRSIIDGMAMQVPFPALIRHLGLLGAGGEFGPGEASPLFRVAFMYQDFLDQLPTLGAGFAALEDIRQEGEYELVVEVIERAGPSGARYTLSWKYDPELYDAATIECMLSHYRELLGQVLTDPDRAVGECEVISEEERRRLLLDWNDTRVAYPSERCVHDLVDEQATKTPFAIAVACGNEVLTYAELRQKSAAWAALLRRSGVNANTLTALCVERSTTMVAGMLAILEAGGAYVPLDPDYPEDRLLNILKDSRAPVLVTQRALEQRSLRLAELASAGAATAVRVVALDEPEHVSAPVGGVRRGAASAGDLAYVIYTSGSTGSPKGVMVPHRALTNFLLSMARQPGIDERDVLLAVTTPCFDIAALELFLPLIRGARCQIADAATAKDPARLMREIDRVRPSLMQATPSTWKLLFHAGWRNPQRVKILCGGEALPESLKEHFVSTGSEAWNLFGPTETTVWSTLAKVEANKPVTIGKPIANTRAYILDERGGLAPIGVPGELCIAGDGVTLGYFEKPALTAAKFLDDPFAGPADASGGKLYRTGDLARWRADGELEHLGRLDFQVKVRGFRVEVQDIEHHLSSHPAVASSAVVARKQADSELLVAYYVPRAPGGAASVGALSHELRQHLARKLPEYMVPGLFVALDELPMTANGKLDRGALSERRLLLREGEGRAAPREDDDGGPRTAATPESGFFSAPTEERLLDLWRSVLGIEDIEPTDGFLDAGGTSVSAVILAERVSAEFGISVGPSTLFTHPNVRDLARHLEQARRGSDIGAASSLELPRDGRAPSDWGGNASRGAWPAHYHDCIAIVGISCRFPGASDHRAFWRNLREGRESARFYSKSELRAASVPEALLDNEHYVPMQLTIDGKDQFDPKFFNLTPKDAALMDPQFRLLLQHSWQAVEDAGYLCRDIADAAVYMSASNSYYQAQLQSSRAFAESDEYQAWLFAQGGTIPTRISYQLGLTGPSLFIHSNCSSGLSALSLAAQSLRLGECRHALVGASTVFPGSSIGYVYQPGLNLSSDGHCRTFDAAADGLTTGEGVAVLLVKRAIDAIEDGDEIYALLRGVAINNDGGEKAGYYAPSGRGQAEVVRRALQSTGVNPETIGYVEAHGTGTKLGDPIEVSALVDVYRGYTSNHRFCGLGSVKPNIGHLDTVAGLSSCIKVALGLKHGTIPPSINFETPNPEIELEGSPFYVVDRLTPWPPSLDTAMSVPVCRGAVSSFGIGGTNAHAILEQFPDRARAGGELDAGGACIVPLSAKNEDRLRVYAERLLAFLAPSDEAPTSLADVAFTLQVGREAMLSRVAFLVETLDELRAALGRFIDGSADPTTTHSGQRDPKSDLVRFIEGDAEGGGLVDAWIRAGQLRKVAALWAKGVQVDWTALHRPGERRRLSLPHYPFAQEPCAVILGASAGAVPNARSAVAQPSGSSAAARRPLHPLLHQQTSAQTIARGGGDEFSSRFDGAEFFLRDHVIYDQKMLPGVAYLEMARAAAELASGAVVTRLTDVVWLKPIIVEAGGREVRLRLQREAEDGRQPRALRFEVSAGADGESGAAHDVFCQGRVELAAQGRPSTEAEPARLDIERLQLGCRPALSAGALYERLARGGGNYGPHFKTIVALSANEREVLAELALPSPPDELDASLYLHPSIMDAAFQIADSLVLEPQARQGRLPFFVSKVSIYRPTPARGHVLVRLHEPEAAPGPVVRYDISIVDGEGRLCVAFEQFSARSTAVVPEAAAPKPALDQTSEPSVPGLAPHELERRVSSAIAAAMAEVIKMDRNEISPEREFGDYGFDSLSLTTLSNRLNQGYGLAAEPRGALNPTIFFEHPTLAQLARYVTGQYTERFQREFGHEVAIPTARRVISASAAPRVAPAPVPATARASEEASDSDAIAIVGMSGRFPAARDVDEFWRNLAEGRDCIREVPADRWDWREYHGDPAVEANKTDVKWGGFIDGIAEFDPLFFNISPREAAQMDPSHRLLLMHVWLAIEDAGHNPLDLAGSKTAIFFGIAQSGYAELRKRAGEGIEANSFLGVVPSIAINRVSHFLDLHGPSEPVETACSSSLVALHRALNSIASGDADMALVGGVQTILTPQGHIGFGKAGMLAKDGRCKAFSSRADGFVRGEGIGVLFLKRLRAARADGDSIYGVIKGSAVNHDGRSNTLTAPNPKAQRDVIVAAHERAGVAHPGVSYIEAHGTGTRLGDPIEVNALREAFAHLDRAAQARGVQPASRASCALGAVKSNVGHLELAAGVAGVIKVLKQIEHRQLVRSLHCDELNPYLELRGDEFHILQQNREWVADVDASGRPFPLRAGVSSFGIGGVNAHVVIEEYRERRPARESEAAELEPVAVLLSAKDPERLTDYARALLAFVSARTPGEPPLRLIDLAYTLQLGREAMPERLGIVVASLAELEQKLGSLLAGEPSIKGLYRGRASRNGGEGKGFQDAEKFVRVWMSKRKYGPILELWVKGETVDWAAQYAAASSSPDRAPPSGQGGERSPRRLHLPGYPFAKERYWVSEAAPARAPAEPVVPLHPLLHESLEGAPRARFRTRLSGAEAFLRDHRVKGNPVLPGVAYLEMACAAFRHAGGARRDQSVRLENVAWVRPLAAPRGATLLLESTLEADQSMSFGIYAESESGEKRLHCEGVARLSVASCDAPIKTREILDLADLRGRFEVAGRAVEPGEWYELFTRAGIEYGPSHRGMQRCFVGELGVLAQLTLTAAAGDGRRGAAQEGYALDPSIMDAALQSAVGLDVSASSGTVAERTIQPRLPFALESLELIDPCGGSMWAWVRPSAIAPAASGAASEAPLRKLDIDLCDEAGRIAVKLRGLSARPLVERSDASGASAAAPAVTFPAREVGLLASADVWDVAPATPSAEPREHTPAADARVVIFGGSAREQQDIQRLFPRATAAREPDVSSLDATLAVLDVCLAQGDIDHIVWLAPDAPASSEAGSAPAPGALVSGDALLAAQEQGVLQLFRLVKGLLERGYATRALSWTVITRHTHATAVGDRGDPTHAGVHGFVGVAAKEYPHWKFRLLDMERGGAWPLQAMFAMPYDEQGSALAYRRGEWRARQLVPVYSLPPGNSLYKVGGVYVVIGGAGGIGAAWSEWMIRTHRARIVWIGRRALDESIRRKIEALAPFGSAPVYVQADAGDKGSLEAARRQIAELSWDGVRSKTSGIVHSAIVLADASLATMSEARFAAALRSKVDASVRVAEVFGNDALDFMLFFSSIASFGRSAGQSNYVAGSVFEDAFARHWADRAPYPVKVVNWGYWGSVGVVSTPAYRERVEKAGFASIEPAEGMQALDVLLSSGLQQLAVVKAATKHALGDRLHRTGYLQSRASESMGGASGVGFVRELEQRLARRAPGWQQQASAAEKVRSPQLEALIASVLATGVQPFLRSRDALDPRYHRWLDESLATLGARGLLIEDGAADGSRRSYRIGSATEADPDRVWQQWRRQADPWRDDANKRAPLRLAEACLQALPRVLRGELPATHVLFPNSTLELVEGLYKGNPLVDLFNGVVHDVVLSSLEAGDPGRAVNIIEIGAGTGGTTAGLLPKLEPFGGRIREYRYTDLSHAFLLHARERFEPHHPYLKTQLFNVENPLAGQGVAENHYDLAIATNVLHATRSIRQSLRNAKAALRAGGLLVLNEISKKTLFAHVTFGLLDGWWLYEDEPLRLPGSPGIGPEAWQHVLESEGFTPVIFPASDLHHLGQQVVVARSNGIVRQRVLPPAAPAQGRDRVKAAASVGPSASAGVSARQAPSDLEHVQQYLREQLVRVLQVPEGKIELDGSFASYGTDSIMALALLRELEKDFGSLPKTLFFEFENISELAAYLVQHHPARAAALSGPGAAAPAAAEPASEREGTASRARSDEGAGKPAAPHDAPRASRAPVLGVDDYLADRLVDVLKVPREKIEVDAPFASYGTDSIMALALIRELELDFGSLPKTLFFEFENILELGQYLHQNHPERLRGLLKPAPEQA